MKCKSCIWANKVNPAVIHCSFPTRCTKEDGWIADKGRGANDHRAHTEREDTTSHVDRERVDKELPVWSKDQLPEQDMSVLPRKEPAMKQGDEVVHVRYGKCILTEEPNEYGDCSVKFDKPIEYDATEVFTNVAMLREPYSFYQ